MKNSRSIAYGALLLTAMATTGLQAQDIQGFGAGASLLSGIGATKAAIAANSGFTVWGSYTFKTDAGIYVRPGLAINTLIGSDVNAVPANADALAATGPYTIPGSAIKHNLTSGQVFAVFVVPIFNNRADWIVGLSLNKYRLKVSDALAGQYSPVDLDAATRSGSPVVRSGDANGTLSVPGYKFGLRFGVDYRINKQFSVQLLLQQTELGRIYSKATQMPTLNPAWLELGASYKF